MSMLYISISNIEKRTIEMFTLDILKKYFLTENELLGFCMVWSNIYMMNIFYSVLEYFIRFSIYRQI